MDVPMGRSVSSPSLLAAGAEATHIPKRATQHGIFLSLAEQAPTSLKPGQSHLRERQLYSDEAPALRQTCIEPDRPSNAIYDHMIGKLTGPDHYKNPTKEVKMANPDPFKGHYGTAHWRSEYKSVVNSDAIAGAKHHRQYGPPYQASNPVTCVTSASCPTSNHEDLGRYGSNPRDRIGQHDSQLPIYRNVMNRGTTRGTLHIPGYQGFLATNTNNPRVAKIERGGDQRPIDKHLLSDQFNSRLVGYAGHKPANAKNDAGGVAVTSITTAGRDFHAPSLTAFA